MRISLGAIFLWAAIDYTGGDKFDTTSFVFNSAIDSGIAVVNEAWDAGVAVVNWGERQADRLIP